ncbi:MAG: PH domain-containing protein [Candidatus Moranbacteria bacterium]|nr:PH domain-containing protein [Candidatus Moranbacteria bacterium]
MKRLHAFHFKEIGEQERIIKVIHRHWFDILQQFFIVIFLVAALASGFFVLPALFSVFQQNNFYALMLFLETIFVLFIWIYAFFVWIDYYFDVWIITSERVVNIEQKGLFMRQVSELKFAKIQDVTAEVEGFFPTILNYGDVHIQTAGEEERFIFRQIPDPYGIKSIVMDLQKQQEAKRVNELGEIMEKIKQ